MTIHFFIASPGDDYANRTDSRVRLIDYDEVSKTYRVEFPDGTRAVVPSSSIVTREEV